MKNYLFILLATTMFASCGPRPTAKYNHNLDETMYYAYNPEDTIGNEPYWLLLRIDSARVEFLSDPVMAMRPTAMIKEIVGDSLVLVDKNRGDTSVYDAAKAKWFELMRLCSQRQYEDALSLYIKEETDIGIALATSTNKFDLDYFVIGPLLFDQLDEEEAAEIMVKFLEYDKFLTESVILFGESQQGYVPPQYAFQIKALCDMYLILDDREKAEALIEPFEKAIHLLSDAEVPNMFAINDFKLEIYLHFSDMGKVKELYIEFREFVVRYCNENDINMDGVLEEIDASIKNWRTTNYENHIP